MTLEKIESWVGYASAVAALWVLGALLLGVFRGLRRPQGRVSGRAAGALRAPWFYLLASIGYFGLCFLLWQPLPLTLSPSARMAALALGALLYFPGLALLLWARLSLGKMYFVSTSLGATLYADHRLITQGPYALVRHPMYLGLWAAALGGLLIYRTWTLVFMAITFLGLPLRARREEQALAAEFREQWEHYSQRVPAWIPRIHR